MAQHTRALLLAVLMMFMPMAGCTTAPAMERPALEGEILEVVESPCSLPTASLVQSSTVLSVNGVDRLFRLSVPASEAGTELPLIIAF